jgi:hypothetical protein
MRQLPPSPRVAIALLLAYAHIRTGMIAKGAQYAVPSISVRGKGKRAQSSAAFLVRPWKAL